MNLKVGKLNKYNDTHFTLHKINKKDGTFHQTASMKMGMKNDGWIM